MVHVCICACVCYDQLTKCDQSLEVHCEQLTKEMRALKQFIYELEGGQSDLRVLLLYGFHQESVRTTNICIRSSMMGENYG